MDLDALLQPELLARTQQQLYRQRHSIEAAQQIRLVRQGRELLNFCSNDYLGLANDPRIKRALTDAVEHWGVGSGSAHLVCGHSDSHHALEQELAELVQRPRALLFSTGYMANIGATIALCAAKDRIFADKLNHASLNDGALLSQARFKRYAHRDYAHLSRLLAATDSQTSRRRLIMTDSLFSMDGDQADLAQLAQLATQHQAILMVDDAHGFGVLGPQGGGSVLAQGLSLQQVPVLVGTLGKAAGTFGAFVAGSESLIEYLIQFARSYVYTTAMPPALAEATRCSLQLIRREDWRRERLSQHIVQFKRRAAELGLSLMASDTAIQPLPIGDSERALRLSQQLADAGFWVSAIRPPTVPQGEARLRITLTALHQPQQIEALLQCLARLCLEGSD